MKNILKKGFTLSEVLIALSIIGVVAALTVPQVINNYNEKAFEALELKAKDTLTQAFDIYLSDLGKNKIKTSDFDNKAHIQDFLTHYTRGKAIDFPTDYRGENGGPMTVVGSNNYGCVKTKDSIMICLAPISNTTKFVVFDLNGSAGPNMKNKDLNLSYRYDINGRVYK